MTPPQIAEFNAKLADPVEREKMIAKQNEESMKALAGFGMPPPPPRRSDS